MSNAVQQTGALESPLWQVPRLRTDQRWLGGVAAAAALEVGVSPLIIRLAFLLLTLSGGVGLALYAATWFWFTYHARRHAAEPYLPVPKGIHPKQRLLGVGLVVAG